VTLVYGLLTLFAVVGWGVGGIVVIERWADSPLGVAWLAVSCYVGGMLVLCYFGYVVTT
jgi:hypothetical protein